MDVTDADHEPSRRVLEELPGARIVPTLVLTEVAYLLERRHGPDAEMKFLAGLIAGEFILEHPNQRDLLRMAELVWQYRDWPLGTVDASVIATAERLSITTIATLDRRHFGAVKPRHVEAFELVP